MLLHAVEERAQQLVRCCEACLGLGHVADMNLQLRVANMCHMVGDASLMYLSQTWQHRFADDGLQTIHAHRTNRLSP